MLKPVQSVRRAAALGVLGAALLAFPAGASMERAQQAQARGDLRAAQIELRNAVRANPNSAEARAALAAASLALGDGDTAEKEARAALERGYDRVAGTRLVLRAYLVLRRHEQLLRDFPTITEPTAVAGQVNAARSVAELALGRRPEARAAAEEAVRLAPEAPETHLALAAVLAAAGDRAGAEAAVDAALVRDARSVEALLRKAQFQFGRGEFDPAATNLATLLGIEPGHQVARITRAEALLRLNRNDEARREVDAVLRGAPASPPALLLSAMLQARAENWRAADETLQRLGGRVADFPDGLLLLAVTKRAVGQAAQAEDAARRFVARRPEDPRGARLLAAIEIAAGRPADAIITLNNLVRRGGADAAALDMLGRLQASQGQPGAAVEALRRAAELAPDNAEIMTRLAAARLATGDVVGATEAAEESLRATPEQAGARAMLAVGALVSGDVAAAEAEFARLSPEARATIGGRFLEGSLQLARAERAAARATFEGLLRDQPGFHPARLGLARLAVAEGRTPDAITLLAEVLRAEPGNADAARQLAAITLARGPDAGAARSALEAAQTAAPAEIGLAAVTAQVLALAGDPARAAALLDTPALQARGRGAQMPMLLAEARAAAGDLPGAEAASRAALAEEPRNVVARRQLALILAQRGDMGTAESVLREGRISQPGDPVLQGTLVGVVRAARGLDAALTLADDLARRSEARPASLSLRGDLLLAAGRGAEAAGAFAAAYREQPSGALAMRRAMALGAAGQADQAAQALSAWLEREPEDVQALSALAQFDLQAGRLAAATQRLDAVVQRRPGDAVALNNLAWTLQARGIEPERALALAERAFFLAPSAASADTLGWILVRAGTAERGVALLRQAVEASRGQSGPDPAMSYRLAFGLKALGRREEAIAALEPVLAGGAAFSERAEAERLLADLRRGG
jgi:putative PEP-CTERM system TPR-repeat lipoprotein